ncbi:MAG TPA: PQQ-binding-like beta-propeller repeat protein, partial [Pirellulaceae bacterium]|nr:PQQ-binding-like beta-propeller repeat protein [Pirellulaceae bacterium]
EVLVIDGLRPERGDAQLWRQDTIEPDQSSRQATIYTQQRTTNNPLLGPRLINYDATNRMNFNSGPLLTGGFCFQRGRTLFCVDPLTGQSLWERALPWPQAEIFGDDELLFVSDATGQQTLMLSAIDGSLLSRRKLEPAERRWATCGRNVLAFEAAGTTIQLRLYDASRQPDPTEPAAAAGEALWTRTVPLGTRGCTIDGEAIGLLEPGGQFTVVSLASGQVRLAVPLEPEPSLSWIQVQTSRDQLVLLASQEQGDPTGNVMMQPLQTVNNPLGRMHGRVYAFQRKTGKLQWQTAAFISQHGMPPDQPAESPLLFFVRNRTEAGRGNTRSTTSVLALDRRDGRPVYENDSVLPQIANNCEVSVEPAKQSVTLSLYGGANKTLVFKLSDKPTPPQPPAQTGSLASSTAGQAPGIVDGTVGAAVELLNRGLNPRILLPRAAPPPPPARP